VELTIYDARGRRVKRLVSGTLPAGPHQAAWQGRDESGRPVAPGVYFVRMTAEAFSGVRKMLLIR
jgi:flagellar hook assembly protein FlgD